MTRLCITLAMSHTHRPEGRCMLICPACVHGYNFYGLLEAEHVGGVLFCESRCLPHLDQTIFRVPL